MRFEMIISSCACIPQWNYPVVPKDLHREKYGVKYSVLSIHPIRGLSIMKRIPIDSNRNLPTNVTGLFVKGYSLALFGASLGLGCGRSNYVVPGHGSP